MLIPRYQDFRRVGRLHHPIAPRTAGTVAGVIPPDFVEGHRVFSPLLHRVGCFLPFELPVDLMKLVHFQPAMP